MYDTVHRLSGQVLSEDGKPSPNVRVFVVDDDFVLDDLIAMGMTGSDGRFQVEFLPEAFNQEPGEAEETPDLYLLLAAWSEQGWVLVKRVDLPASREIRREIGAVTLPGRASPQLEVSLTQFQRWARRISLDEVRARQLVSEMAQVVQQLTGWRELERGLSVELVPDLGVVYGRSLASLFAGGQLDPVRRRALQRGQTGFLAMYEPFERTIFLSRRAIEAQGLDGARVVLGHELVHVGQYEHHPELKVRYREIARQQWDTLATGEPSPEHVLACFEFMANLEGYASHIEHDFLRPRYNCALPLPHLDLLGRLGRSFQERREARELLERAKTSPGRASFQGMGKAEQYWTGRTSYLQRQSSSEPAAFDPALRVAPGGHSPHTLSELRRKATQGSAAHQHDLGTLLATGQDLAQDLDEAENWLRKAVQQGLPNSAVNLAALVLYPRGEEDEALQVALSATGQDYFRAEALVGILYLERKKRPPDLAQGLAWLRKAAEGGEPLGQYVLGLAYLRGQGVARSEETARAWLERAARQGHEEAAQLLASFTGSREAPSSP